MSAFVVSDRHINAIVTYAEDHKDRLCWPRELEDPLRRYDKLAAMMKEQNISSVHTRYPDDELMIPPAGERGIVYQHHRDWVTLNPLQIIMLCNCFDYQSCETEGYRDTMVAEMVDRIRHAAIADLPGYDECEWTL